MLLVLGAGYVGAALAGQALQAGEDVLLADNWYATRREQLVILSQVLPDTTTRYRTYRNEVVASVDGKVPNDFREFVALVEGGGDLVKVEFEGVNVPPLVLERKKLAEAHARICKNLNIPEDRHVKEPK